MQCRSYHCYTTINFLVCVRVCVCVGKLRIVIKLSTFRWGYRKNRKLNIGFLSINLKGIKVWSDERNWSWAVPWEKPLRFWFRLGSSLRVEIEREAMRTERKERNLNAKDDRAVSLDFELTWFYINALI